MVTPVAAAAAAAANGWPLADGRRLAAAPTADAGVDAVDGGADSSLGVTKPPPSTEIGMMNSRGDLRMGSRGRRASNGFDAGAGDVTTGVALGADSCATSRQVFLFFKSFQVWSEDT